MLCCGLTPALHGQYLRGVIEEETPDGKTVPLEGVSVQWLGTQTGTYTDTAGYFSLKKVIGHRQLLVRHAGYRHDTLFIADTTRFVHLQLRIGHELHPVRIVSTKEGSYISGKLIQTQVITTEGLRRAACCNLAESFETTASVDVSYSDAVSGAKQIQMLGLAGKYSQIMLENTPYVRGLSNAFGLMYIPGSWMENISISKGTASVINGYESITGQIDVEYKKPRTSQEAVFVNLFANSMMKYEGNANFHFQLGEKVSDMLLLHVGRQPRMADHNHDGFTEMPVNTQFNIMNRWDYHPTKNWEGRSMASYLYDTRTGGQIGFKRSLAGDSSLYGIGIDHQQFNFITKNGIMLKGEHASIGTIASVTYRDYHAFYGFRHYDAEQWSGYANIIYENFMDHAEKHKLNAGASLQFDLLQEQWEQTPSDRTEVVPGAFAQYSFIPNKKFVLMAGLRADHHNQYGWLWTPRLHMKWQILEQTSLRGTFGKGYRSANPYIEHTAYMASSRALVREEEFRMEEAVNTGASLTQTFRIRGNESTFAIDYYFTRFLNQIIADADRSPYAVYFHNLKGESYSHAIQSSLTLVPVTRLELLLAYRYNHVMETTNGLLQEKAMSSPHKALLNIHYATRYERWKFDFTTQWNGRSRLPDASQLPEALRHPDEAPSFFVINAQLSRQFKHWEWYLGAENIGNYTQEQAIIDAENPFGPYFDASIVYAPLTGRMFYAGCRYILKEKHQHNH
ncbi:MAG: TonB-dependent receptor [Bacteroidales bacterium]|nr:TonB-dependent receptor [Bacteroidales bacterium]